MRKLIVTASIAALAVTAGCQKTGEGEYEVERPAVGTETDTVRTPDVDVGTEKDTINVPKVTTEKEEVNVPDVDVNTPSERDSENQNR